MIVAVTMVRDEADIIGHTLEHLFYEGVDHIIVADNRSTDDTRNILEAFAATYPVTVLDDPEVAYYQADKMTRLAHMAHGMGTDWVLPFDADELWYSPHGRLSDVLADCPAQILKATEYKHWPTPDDSDDANPFTRMEWRETKPLHLSKVVFRSHPDAELHMGNHDIELDGERMSGVLEMRHFAYRTFDQFCRKVRNGREAYEATNLHGAYGTHWRKMGAWDQQRLAEEWESFLHRPGLTRDPAPTRETTWLHR